MNYTREHDLELDSTCKCNLKLNEATLLTTNRFAEEPSIAAQKRIPDAVVQTVEI